MTDRDDRSGDLDRQRSELLGQVERWLEAPMVALGVVWLALLVAELLGRATPFLEKIATAILIVFILDFGVRFALAPRKLAYLKGNWITALALLLPALRVLRAFRAVRALRAVRGVRLVRLLTSVNRGMRSLGRTMRRRGLGYVLALTTIVYLAGAAGMLAFERSASGGSLRSFADALWWTAMLLTTIGFDYWPRTAEGRLLTLFLSMYALGILGYVTATLASFFLGYDAESEEGEIASEVTLRALHAEVEALRAEIRATRPSGR